MEHRDVTQLITLDGSALLAQAQVNKRHGRPVCLDADLIQAVSPYRENALLYQIRQVLKEDFSQTLFMKELIFVNFWEFFQHQDTGRNALFEALLREGFYAQWPDSQQPVHYVPFEKSQNQAKDCVLSFIREELFLPVRRRLDLDIEFSDYESDGTPFAFPLKEGVSQLSKLYAYRALYLSEAIRLEGIAQLLDENRIVILNESPITFQMDPGSSLQLCTAHQTGVSKRKGQAILEEELLNASHASYKIEPFDGVGLISPRGAALLNRALDEKRFASSGIDPQNTDPRQLQEKGMAVSFQFRLPFCKGMLHTVDFHRFLREEGQLDGEIWVEDIFGVRRNLNDADIILNQTLFKLFGLLRHELKDPDRKARFITHYFQKLRHYGHSIYIARTDLQLRPTGFTRLTSQIINTLPFTQEGFDRLVRRHTDRAQQYRLPAIILENGKLPIFEENSADTVHKYISTHPCLALDEHMESLIASCRAQALHRLYLGKLDVEGDMRFLCRDLIYYLHRIAKRCGSATHFQLIPRGSIYMPGETAGPLCAVFRSPHLCPNENVSARMFEETQIYRKYLGHLKRVVFVGTYSQMPDALGGADFDGDLVVLAFQPEVVEACEKSCYREDGSGLPLIQIPSLKQRSTDATACKYVNVQTIQNTFNSQIGMISNATMKICAAEAVTEEALPFSSRFCAILNGVEIDAAKTGVRPWLDPVLAFTGKPGADEDAEQKLVHSIPADAAKAMQLVKTYLQVRKDLQSWELPGLTLSDDGKKYTVKYGGQEITRFSKETGNVPFVYQLLLRWAEAFGTEPEDQTQLKAQAADALYAMLPGKKPTKSRSYPRDAILKKVVFRCPARIDPVQASAMDAVTAAYSAVKAALDAVRKNSDPAQRRILRRNLIHLLQWKYDDIDSTDQSGVTIRQVGSSLGTQLAQQLDTAEKLSSALGHGFYCTGENADPWLFRWEQDRIDWLRDVTDGPTAEIAGDFDFHGYDLVYFALREQQARAAAAELRQTLHTQTGDPFQDALFRAAAEAMELGHTTFRICSHILPPLCRKQLETLTGKADPQALIPLVYGHLKAKNRGIFWKLFSWEEISAYLKEVHDHAR